MADRCGILPSERKYWINTNPVEFEVTTLSVLRFVRQAAQPRSTVKRSNSTVFILIHQIVENIIHNPVLLIIFSFIIFIQTLNSKSSSFM